MSGEDHGTIMNYIEKSIKRAKVTYIFGIPSRKQSIKNSIPNFKFLEQLKNHGIKVSENISEHPKEKEEKIKGFEIQQFMPDLNYLSQK